MRNGKGKMKTSIDEIYNATWENDNLNGKGTFTNKKGVK